MSEKNEEQIKHVEYKDTGNIGYETQIDDSRNFNSIFREHMFSSGLTRRPFISRHGVIVISCNRLHVFM